MGINIELPVSGGGGVSIGDAIGGASANQILITDGSGNLSERPNILTSTGGGSNFLADDGTYKAVSTGISLGDAIGGASANQILITDGSGNLSERPNILTSTGGGSNFLADDGTYKAVSASIAIGDAVGGSIANTLLFVDAGANLGNNIKLAYQGGYFYHTGVNTTSAFSTQMGFLCGSGNFSTNSTFYGNSCGASTNSASNVAVGRNACNNASGTSEGVYVGNDAGFQSSGIRGNYIGFNAGRQNSGAYCVGVGDYTLFNGNGDTNVAIGANAMNSSTTSQSVACGVRSLFSGSGSANTALGYGSGESNSGSNVLALGFDAGKSNTQSNRLIIGQTNLPQFAGAAAAAAALPAAGANGVYLYWDTTDNTIKARP